MHGLGFRAALHRLSSSTVHWLFVGSGEGDPYNSLPGSKA